MSDLTERIKVVKRLGFPLLLKPREAAERLGITLRQLRKVRSQLDCYNDGRIWRYYATSVAELKRRMKRRRKK